TRGPWAGQGWRWSARLAWWGSGHRGSRRAGCSFPETLPVYQLGLCPHGERAGVLDRSPSIVEWDRAVSVGRVVLSLEQAHQASELRLWHLVPKRVPHRRW